MERKVDAIASLSWQISFSCTQALILSTFHWLTEAPDKPLLLTNLAIKLIKTTLYQFYDVPHISIGMIIGSTTFVKHSLNQVQESY